MKKISLCLLMGCAATNPEVQLKQEAYVTAMAVKETVDLGYNVWDERANARVGDCFHRLPPTEHSKSEYDACVGPYNEGNQRIAVSILDGLRTAQLALFVALAENRSSPEVRQALNELRTRAAELRTFLEEHQ